MTLDPAERTVLLRGGAEIDLGAIAKGAALDAARETFVEAGIDSALLHGGGSSIIAIGAPTDEDAWVVRLGEADGAPSVRLRDQSLSYSAARRDGVEHVMDPRSGRHARSCDASACIGESAMETDAWATALLVLGERPEAMGAHLTSAVCREGEWTLEGPASSTIELCSQEIRS